MSLHVINLFNLEAYPAVILTLECVRNSVNECKHRNISSVDGPPFLLNTKFHKPVKINLALTEDT
jgi:hypothetical protein